MRTLKEIGEYVALQKGDPHNTVLQREAIYQVRNLWALLVRRDAERNVTTEHSLSTIIVPLTVIDKNEDYNISSGQKILESTIKVPDVVRTKDTAPFTYVGDFGFTKSIPYIPASHTEHIGIEKFSVKSERYSYIKGKIRLHCNLLREVLYVQGLFDVQSIIDFNTELNKCTNDDVYLPISADMISIILEQVLQIPINNTKYTTNEIPITV